MFERRQIAWRIACLILVVSLNPGIWIHCVDAFGCILLMPWAMMARFAEYLPQLSFWGLSAGAAGSRFGANTLGFAATVFRPSSIYIISSRAGFRLPDTPKPRRACSPRSDFVDLFLGNALLIACLFVLLFTAILNQSIAATPTRHSHFLRHTCRRDLLLRCLVNLLSIRPSSACSGTLSADILAT
jgi:hypothetical protein